MLLLFNQTWHMLYDCCSVIQLECLILLQSLTSVSEIIYAISPSGGSCFLYNANRPLKPLIWTMHTHTHIHIYNNYYLYFATIHCNHLMWLGVYFAYSIHQNYSIIKYIYKPCLAARYTTCWCSEVMCTSLMDMDYSLINLLHSRWYIWHMHLLTIVYTLHLSYETYIKQ